MSPEQTTSPKMVEQSAPAAPRVDWARTAEVWALPVFAVLAVICFAVLPSTAGTFLTGANIRITLANQAVVLILAVAALLPLMCGEFDLSVGANLGLSHILAASVMSQGGSLALAAGTALGAGLTVGIVNAFLVTVVRVNGVVTTLGTALVLHGLVQWKTNGETIVRNISTQLTDLGGSTVVGIPTAFLAALAITVAVYYVVAHTPQGRYWEALGMNARAVELVGLRPRLLLAQSFVISGLLAGVAALIQISRAGGASPAVGESFTLPALAAAFLSAAAIRPGRFNVGGVVVAVGFLAVINSGLNLLGAAVYINDLVNGIALIVGVGSAGFLGRLRMRH